MVSTSMGCFQRVLVLVGKKTSNNKRVAGLENVRPLLKNCLSSLKVTQPQSLYSLRTRWPSHLSAWKAFRSHMDVVKAGDWWVQLLPEKTYNKKPFDTIRAPPTRTNISLVETSWKSREKTATQEAALFSVNPIYGYGPTKRATRKNHQQKPFCQGKIDPLLLPTPPVLFANCTNMSQGFCWLHCFKQALVAVDSNLPAWNLPPGFRFEE